MLVLTIIPLILSIGFISSSTFSDALKSPRQQMNDGVSAQDVICKGGYTLMIRIGGDAACVTPSTANKLNSAGWGEIIKEFDAMSEPQDEGIALNEEISMEDQGTSDGEESDGETFEINIKDGVGSSDNP